MSLEEAGPGIVELLFQTFGDTFLAHLEGERNANWPQCGRR